MPRNDFNFLSNCLTRNYEGALRFNASEKNWKFNKKAFSLLMMKWKTFLGCGGRSRESERDAASIDNVKQHQSCWEPEWNGKYRRRVACWTSLTDLHSLDSVLPQHGNSSCFSSSRWQHTEAKESCMAIGASPTHSTRGLTCALCWLCAEQNAVLAHLGENMAKRFSQAMWKKVKNRFCFLQLNDGKYFQALGFLFQYCFMHLWLSWDILEELYWFLAHGCFEWN